MKGYITILFILLVIPLCSCQFERKEKLLPDGKIEIDTMTIVIQPFDDFPPSLTDSLCKQLKAINPKIILRDPIPLPDKAYYKPRNRYRADSLNSYLWQMATTKSVVIGLTTKDISVRKGNMEDWGVMGLAYMPGHSCVVSTYRLSKKNLHEQLYKVAIHELGHTQGVAHCEYDKSCYMRDAGGGNPLDEETHFCSYCKSHLEGKGWNLSN